MKALRVAVKQAAMEQAGHSLMVGDGSKFRKSAVVRFSGKADSLSLVTETRPAAEVLAVLQASCIIA